MPVSRHNIESLTCLLHEEYTIDRASYNFHGAVQLSVVTVGPAFFKTTTTQ